MPAPLVITIDDVFVHLGTTVHVIRLDGEHLLQRVGGTVCLQRPDLHLTKSLPTKLRLTTQRLLGNQAVGPGERACILSSTRWLSFSMYM